MPPKLTIVLPTYNRAAFLPDAFRSIQSQSFQDWEMIVIDDGSTDNTHELVRDFTSTVTNSVTYIKQANQGAYVARKKGIEAARGDFISFYDSDDIWMENHLSSCIEMLEKHPIDWVVVRDSQVQFDQTITSYEELPLNPIPEQLKTLKSSWDGNLQIYMDPELISTLIKTGHNCGLPLSVIRKQVFEKTLFRTEQRNGEDRFFLIRALTNGFRLGQLHEKHYIFRSHHENSSAAAIHGGLDHRRKVYRSLTSGYLKLITDVALSNRQRKLIRHRVASDLFWCVGYQSWLEGDAITGLQEMREAIGHNPLNFSLWKTFLLCKARATLV